MSAYLDLPTRSLTEVLNERLAADLMTFLTSWKERAVAAGRISKYADPQLMVYGNGTGFMVAGGLSIDGTLPEVFAKAEAVISGDDIAEMNLTLGLTPDGRYASAPSAG